MSAAQAVRSEAGEASAQLVTRIAAMVVILRQQSADWPRLRIATREAISVTRSMCRLAFELDAGTREELVSLRDIALNVSLACPTTRASRIEEASAMLAHGVADMIDGFLTPTVDLAMAEVALREIEHVVAKLAGAQ